MRVVNSRIPDEYRRNSAAGERLDGDRFADPESKWPAAAATAKKVWRAVTELNYYPNSHARALVSGRSRLIGLIVSDITNLLP